MLGLALLAGLLAPFIGNKYWHWSQLVLLLSIVLAATGFLFLAAETLRVHRALRARIPQMERELASLQQQNEQLIIGSGEQQGLRELEHRLKIVTRERGRVWRGVQPVGEVDNQGRVEVEISQPQPHGLETDTIVFVFEAGDVNAADPASGRQYLGEFRVSEAKEGGVALEPVLLIDQRTGQRLVDSQGPWSLYETMPVDRHKLYADSTEEELRQALPAASVEEYLRHGKPATEDDDQWHRIGLDENDERVGPENLDQAVTFLYDRPLRDYAYLYAELAQQRVVLRASRQAVLQDNAKLAEALKSAKQLSEFREQEKLSLSSDLEGMQRDRQAIEAHRDQVQLQLANANRLIDQMLARNSALVNQLTDWQLGMIQYINSTAPAPAAVSTLVP